MLKKWILWCFCAFTIIAESNGRWHTLYQKISSFKEVSEFNSALQNDQEAKSNIHNREVTVLAPTNDAINRFEGTLNKDVLAYHLVAGVQTLGRMGAIMHPISHKQPPIWVTKINDDFYVNNAKIVLSRSNQRAYNRLDSQGKEQVLHVIDQVLDPVGNGSNAYTVMQNWDRKQPRVETFRRKVVQLGMHVHYLRNCSSTFLVPIDAVKDVDYLSMEMLDSYAIRAHIIPDIVLFTRPLYKQFPYETMANDGYINVIATFYEDDSRLFVKTITLEGDSNHPKGSTVAEIVRANIPVRNGVVHLISNPLMVVQRPSHKFPYRAIYDKLTSDPMLNITYALGEQAGFNEQFQDERKLFTYFIPRDHAWTKLMKKFELPDLDSVESHAQEILAKHVLVGEEMYTMEQLQLLTKDKRDGSFFRTLGGELLLKATKRNGDFFLMLKDKFVRVTRANYECTNGIVHVVDDVMVSKEEMADYQVAADRTSKLNITFMIMKMYNVV